MKLYKISIALCICVSMCYGQKIDSTANQIQFPGKYYSKVDQNLNSINDRLTKKSLKYLAKFQRHEKKLQEKLGALNADAKQGFANSNDQYNQFKNKIQAEAGNANPVKGEYNSYIDTLSTSLSFLKKFSANGDVTKPIESLNNLQRKLQESEKIKQFVAERKKQLRDLLSKYTKIPAGLSKEYAKLDKTAYYYSAQVKEYKEMMKDPSKAEKKAMSLLNKLPAFQKFMQNNSQLASMFRMPDNYGSSQSLVGLQTRASVQGLIQQRIGSAPNAQQVIRQNIAQAQSELSKLKDKIGKLGGGSDLQMPDFKPNTEKTKSFLQRLEYGGNIQFAKSSSLFPSTANIGLSLGYKLGNKSITGIGMSYKMGMGTLRHVTISHQGIGLRSFTDYKIKKSLYLSGGYEMNYNAQFKKFEELKNLSGWQSSGLIGISKKYNVNNKVKGEMKLLYDFLANSHTSITQPIVFRVGYIFK